MKKMEVVSPIGIVLNSKNDIKEYLFSFPEGTEILSVSSYRKDTKDFLSIQIMYPVGAASANLPWQEFSFIVVRCNCSEVTIDEHKYIGTITIDNNTFVVFCKKGKIVTL